jgi:hypothetical protein
MLMPKQIDFIYDALGIIEVGTYAWNTTAINSNVANTTMNITAYAAWLK